MCGTLVRESDLGRAGITKAEIDTVRRHIRDGTFGKVLQLLDIVMGKLDPEKMNKDLQTKNAIAEILRALGEQELAAKRGSEDILKVLNEIRLKLAGPGIGKVGEAINVKDFKAAIIDDTFSDEKADKHGADIVATVNEDKKPIGKIVISVKYDNQWKRDFIRQLQTNMNQEGTDFGLLATNSLPKEALSDKVMVVPTTSGDGLILLVKQEYASVAYQGLRYAVIAWEKAKKTIHEAQQRIDERARIFKAVLEWINGRQFKETIDYVNACKKLSEETDALAMQIRDHTIRKVKSLLEVQQQMKNNLGYTSESINELKRILSGEGEEHSSSPS
jgi:hypothetical protein